jgi:hypothetical protein
MAKKKKTTRRKSPTKKKATRKKAVSFGGARKASTAKFKQPNRKRGTQYQPLLDAMEKLRPGQMLPVEVPQGISARVYHNRLNSVIRRYEPKPAKGCAFTKRTLEDGRIAILCERVRA